MKVREYIYQTGECLTYDTDTGVLRPDIYAIALDLIHKGSGTFPTKKSIHYSFSDEGNMAHHSVTGRRDELILMAKIVPCRGPYLPTMSNLDWAVKYLDIIADGLREGDWPVEKKLPGELVTPCMVTLLMPGAIRLNPDTIAVLKDIRRNLACAWLASKSEFPAPLAVTGAIEPDMGMDESELRQIRSLLSDVQEGLCEGKDLATVNCQWSALNGAVKQLSKAIGKSSDRERTKELFEVMMRAYRYRYELAKLLQRAN